MHWMFYVGIAIAVVVLLNVIVVVYMAVMARDAGE
jgi:hypothetical protein